MKIFYSMILAVKVSKYWILGVIACSLLLAGCRFLEPTEPVTVGGTAFYSMSWMVKLDRIPDQMDSETLQKNLQHILDSLNHTLSTYQNDTELMQFNRAPVGQWVKVSPTLLMAVEKAIQVSVATQGRYDITVGPLVNLWGFGPSRPSLEVPSASRIAEAKSRVGWQYIKIDNANSAMMRIKDIQLDLSSIGEGVAVDGISEQLRAWQVKGFMVSVAGCTRVQGNKRDGKPWVIAIEKPDGSGDVQQILRLHDHVISTSGSYRNYREIDGKRYSHTIDPVTGAPIVHKGVSVSVVMAGDTISADAWATALNVLGPDEGYNLAVQKGIAAYFIRHTPEGASVRYTPAFNTYLPE